MQKQGGVREWAGKDVREGVGEEEQKRVEGEGKNKN